MNGKAPETLTGPVVGKKLIVVNIERLVIWRKPTNWQLVMHTGNFRLYIQSGHKSSLLVDNGIHY